MGIDIVKFLKSSTFAIELVAELSRNSHNLLVISFSVINYVVRMRHPRVSGEVSFFLYAAQKRGLLMPVASLQVSVSEDSPF